MPNRDCAASASNGEYSVASDGLEKYKAYIDAIKTQLNQYTDVPVALIIEPDSLGNLVTNANIPNCSAASDAYKTGIQYAIKTLNAPNVAQYLDAGHAGWLGWPSNIGPAAQLFAQVYKGAGSPASVRGLATNVANYNAWSTTSCPSYTQGSKVCDEKTYINNLAPLLTQNGFPAHFIIDTCQLTCHLPFQSMHSADLLAQHATANSPQASRPGATGATSRIRALALPSRQTPTTRSPMLSLGSSRAGKAMVPAIRQRRDTISIAAPRPACSLLPRLERGSRRTLNNLWQMPTLL